MRSKILVLIAFLVAVAQVHAVSAQNLTVNVTKVYVLDQSGTTPFNIWAGAIILGAALLIISLLHFPGGEEDFVSVLAWIPIAYAMFASFAVDMATGAGVGVAAAGTEATSLEVHTIYSFWPIAIVLFVVLIFAFVNTYRIVTNHRKESLPQQVEGGG
jgi:hypothetical protein